MMRHKTLLWSAVCISVLCLQALTCQAKVLGWKIDMLIDGKPATIYAHETWGVKTIMERGHMISRLDRQQMIYVNPNNNTHAVMPHMDRSKLKAMQGGSMPQTMQNLPPDVREHIMRSLSQSQEDMKHMSPQDRARAQQALQRQMRMLGMQQPPKTIAYKSTKDRKKINGFNTWKVVKYENGQPTEEMWVAKVKDWQRMAKVFEHAFPNQNKEDRIPYEQIGGVPILTDGSEVKRITPTSLTEKDFLPPKNSRQVDPMEIMDPTQ
jgi:hypothetical protein